MTAADIATTGIAHFLLGFYATAAAALAVAGCAHWVRQRFRRRPKGRPAPDATWEPTDEEIAQAIAEWPISKDGSET